MKREIHRSTNVTSHFIRQALVLLRRPRYKAFCRICLVSGCRSPRQYLLCRSEAPALENVDETKHVWFGLAWVSIRSLLPTMTLSCIFDLVGGLFNTSKMRATTLRRKSKLILLPDAFSQSIK